LRIVWPYLAKPNFGRCLPLRPVPLSSIPSGITILRLFVSGPFPPLRRWPVAFLFPSKVPTGLAQSVTFSHFFLSLLHPFSLFETPYFERLFPQPYFPTRRTIRVVHSTDDLSSFPQSMPPLSTNAFSLASLYNFQLVEVSPFAPPYGALARRARRDPFLRYSSSGEERRALSVSRSLPLKIVVSLVLTLFLPEIPAPAGPPRSCSRSFSSSFPRNRSRRLPPLVLPPSFLMAFFPLFILSVHTRVYESLFQAVR